MKKTAGKIITGVSERAMKSRELLIKAINKIILRAKGLTIPIHKPEPDKYKNNDEK